MKMLLLQLLITTLVFPNSLFAQEEKKQTILLEETNLLLVEGGTFNMGQDAEKDIVRRVTVSSFYVDATQVTNKEYRDFVNYLAAQDAKLSNEMLPDTLIWSRSKGPDVGPQLAKDYFRAPAFDYYPVVGVSWMQVTAFAEWRSDRYNEQLAIENGCWTAELQKKHSFSTKAFLAGDYDKKEGKKLAKCSNTIYPNYRLLSEAEWESAAWALMGEQEQVFDPQATEGKEKHHKKTVDKYRKLVLQHAKKHPLPDYYNTKKYDLPKSVFEGSVNRYGIYNLNDNAAEWVQDSYRPITKRPVVNPNTPAPNVERGTNVDAVPADKMNDMEESWEEVLANGKAAAKEKAIDPNKLMVVKGASKVTANTKNSPGNRSSAKASGQYERLIGFRCGMTRVDLKLFFTE